MTTSYPTGENSAFQNFKFNQKHLTEWVEGSAVNEAIARLNIESLTDKEFNERIRPKEPIKTGGWWCRGVNWRTGVFMGTWYGQGKPDKPHHPEGSKERKYLTASGMEPDAIFLAMSDKGYWAKVHADLSIPRHWAEGVKKAGAGLSLGLAVLALTGVWNWGKDGKLAKFVEEWAQPGTTHYIDFDSDYAAKPSCRAAIIKFAQLLIERDCTVHITCWDAEFKGMDDLIVGKGGDAFLQAAAEAPAFAEWDKSLGAGAKILNHPKFEVSNRSDLAVKIDELLDSDLKRSQLQIKVSDLAQTYRLAPIDVWKIYRTREEELQQELEQEDTAAEVARLLSSQRAQLDLGEILPAQLAAPIETLAGLLNLKTECYLIALLTQVSSLFKVGSEVLLRRRTDYRCTPNYFGVIVSESSQKKSPVLKATIDRPMQSLREKARKEYDKAVAQYEEEYRQWKAAKGEDKGLPPKEPRQRLYSFSKSTGEGILYQVAEYPDQALMYRCDELAGLFKSANQYRGGKGSDEEDLLEFWNGTGSTVLRASGTKADLDGLLLSIFGTIQPDVLAALLKDCSDSNGKFARFDFVFQPVAASKLPEDDSGTFDLTPMLSSLYTKIDVLPALKMELAPEAKRFFTVFYNAMEERREKELKQGMRAMIGKMPEKVGKMAAIIHVLSSVFNGVEVNLQIPKSAVEAAIKFVKFTADQIASLYAEFSDRQALAPSLVKIISLAERKGGTISLYEIRQSFNGKERPEVQRVREWLTELSSLKYGEVTSEGRKITFTLSPQSTLSTLAPNSDTEKVYPVHILKTSSPQSPQSPILEDFNVDESGLKVDYSVHIPKPLFDKALSSNVDNVDLLLPVPKNTQPLMMSCTTEVSPEDGQKLRDIALIWWPEYYPEHLQNLLTQMYAWNAPGTKYDVATIAEWLEGEDALVRDRINELIHRRRG
jgi:hypothetical protein